MNCVVEGILSVFHEKHIFKVSISLSLHFAFLIDVYLRDEKNEEKSLMVHRFSQPSNGEEEIVLILFLETLNTRSFIFIRAEMNEEPSRAYVVVAN